MQIEISQIKIESRLRKDPGNIEELAQSIKEYGLLSPIIIRKIGDDSYKLLAGWRRISACKLLQYDSIECIIKKHE